MARVILHIGTHKTGTTTIQALFRKGADVLARHGVIYPRLDHGDAHHICSGTRKSWSSKNGAKSGSENAYDILVRRYADSQDTVFLSSEEFSRYNMSKRNFVDFNKIRDLLKPFEKIEVVCVLRCQWQFMQSAYLQVTKSRVSKSPAIMVEDVLQDGLYDGLAVDYNLLLNRLEQFFEPSELTFFDYSTICREEGGIIGGLLRHLETPLQPQDLARTDTERKNVSIEPLARWSAHELVPVAEPWLLDVTDRSLREWTCGEQCRSSIFTSDEIARLNAHFIKRNEAFSKRISNVQPGFEITGYDVPEHTIFRDQLDENYWTRVAKELAQTILSEKAV
jgi:hypothetical protein